MLGEGDMGSPDWPGPLVDSARPWQRAALRSLQVRSTARRAGCRMEHASMPPADFLSERGGPRFHFLPRSSTLCPRQRWK